MCWVGQHQRVNKCDSEVCGRGVKNWEEAKAGRGGL